MSKVKIPTYSSTTLVQHIADTVKDNKTIRYCFILGAGASKSSGIKTGGELAGIWFDGIKRLFPDDYEEWIKSNGIDVGDLASSYGKIYKRRFEVNPEEGYHFIQTEIANSKPSYGYSVLARLLGTQHNVVITTNFDPLTEDALFIYTENRPLVCGHESLSKFVTPTTNRPIVIKIHRDQLLAPKSAEDELSSLEQGFKESLDSILRVYKPIVIGYGGNDPSLMDYLKDCDLLDGVFWCKRSGDKLSSRITDLLRLKNGKIFEIPGFDELMFQLHAAVFIGDRPLNELITQTAAARAEEWGNQYAQLSGELIQPESKAALLKLVTGKAYESWWDVQLAANAASETGTKDKIYLAGIDQFPQSVELLENYALFLTLNKKDYDAAEKYYLKVMELDPDEVRHIGNYAIVLDTIKKDYDAAEKYYLKALELDPDEVRNIGAYANFLYTVKKDYDAAEKYFLKALELGPDEVRNIGAYADFLYTIKKNYDAAEKYYLKALELNPNDVRNIGIYPTFLANIKKDYDAAEKYYLKKLELDPDDGDTMGNYAHLLIGQGKVSNAAQFIDRAFKTIQFPDQNALLVELWFYRFANFYKEYPHAEKELQKLLADGVRSEGWDFSPNIKDAKKKKHPKIDKVIEYAEKISKNKY